MKKISIKKESKLLKFIKTIFLFAFHKLENNSINFKDGEEYTVNAILNSYSKENGQFVFIDVGANVGNYSNYIVHVCSQKGIDYEGHLFEPVKENFIGLENKLKLLPTLHLNNFGISDVEKNIDIHLGGAHSSIDRYEMIGAYTKREYNDLEVISVKRLDSYLQQKNITRVDFLKIDTEGHEMKVLESIKTFLESQKIDFIQYEYGDGHIFTKNFCRDFYTFFERYSYRVFKIKPNYFEDRDYNFYMENFKTCNFIAISKSKLGELIK